MSDEDTKPDKLVLHIDDSCMGHVEEKKVSSEEVTDGES